MSIKQHGLLQPIIVRPNREIFEIVAGNRRFAACKVLRLPKIPCIVKDLNDREAFELALTENVQRKSLNPVEEALAFRQYISESGWGSGIDLARKLGKSPSYISQRIALLRLPVEIQKKIEQGEILPSIAREFGSAKDGNDMDFLASLALSRDTSSREMHRFAESLKPTAWPGDAKELVDKDLKILRKSILVLRVAMSRMATLIENAEDETTKEHLFYQRSSLHEMVDTTIRLSMKRKSGNLQNRF